MFCWFYTAEYSKLVKKGINFFYLMHAFRHVLLLFFGVAVSQDPISPGDQLPRRVNRMARQCVCALLASHFLVTSYLQDLLKKLDVDCDPVILSAHNPSSSGAELEPGTVVVVDLQDLPYPVSAYLETFQGAPFIGLDLQRSISDTASLLMAGFAGFVPYSDVCSSLALAINAVARGDTWTSPEVLRAYVALTSRRAKTTGNGLEVLTPRESQILELLRKRYSNKEMAEFFRISESTIKFHVSNVFAKLNVSRRTDLSRSVPGNYQMAENIA